MYLTGMREDLQLRVEIEPGKNGYRWQVVSYRGDHVDHILTSGKSHDLQKVLKEGGDALVKETYSPDPIRHEWDCSCGAQLVIEARRSRVSPYSWDSPREVTCSCGRAYGVKLNFAAGGTAPIVEALSRDR